MATSHLFWGKVSKVSLVKEILRQELASDKPLDRKKVLLLASKRLEEYTPEEKQGVVLNNHDITRALSELKKEKTTNNSTCAAVQDVVTLQQLRSAQQFLKECGSLTRARDLIELLASLK